MKVLDFNTNKMKLFKNFKKLKLLIGINILEWLLFN